jgi:hypothetical protein
LNPAVASSGGHDFQFAGGNFGTRPFEESVIMNSERKQLPQTRMAYDEVPLEEYLSHKAGSSKNYYAQNFLRFKGFNQQAEYEEEQARLKGAGLSLQQ